jgi:polysaccharide export outer membrane protein
VDPCSKSQHALGGNRAKAGFLLRSGTQTWLVIAAAVSLGLAGCSTLPEDGPSARGVTNGARPEKSPSYALVDVDYRVTEVIAAHPSAPLSTLKESVDPGPSDLIGVGDTLAVSVFVPGSGPAPQQAGQEGANGAQNLLQLVVDRGGAISVPFAGLVPVANLTPESAAAAIRRALQGKVANPQVIVTAVTSPRNSVIVLGEVKKPGRFPLGANNDKLLDALAAAGGPTMAARDLALTVVRGDQSATISVAALLADPAENIRLAPQDQVRIIASPRKVDVFGAVGKGSQIPIEDDKLTLAGALGRIGGLSGGLADARSVLVFRFERTEVAKALGISYPQIPGLKSVPVIYRFNLRDPSGYFIANKFEVIADDLVYVPTASSAELEKFLTIVNTAGQFLYDASVTKSLGL